MKKAYFKFIPILFACGVLVTSCKDKDEVQKNNLNFPNKYSELSPEENKENLENNGIQLMNEVTSLKETKTIEASISFSNLMSSASNESEMRKLESNKAVSLMRALSSFGKGKTTATSLLTNLRTAEDTAEYTTPQEMFDEAAGVYTWNSSMNTWDETASTNKIIFKFPSTQAGTSNDAVFTISNYSGVTVSEGMDGFTAEMPTSLNADLTIGGTKELEYLFTASYNSKGEPTMVKTSLFLNPFMLSAEASNSTSEVKSDCSFKKGNSTLLAIGSSAKGNFNTANLEEAANVGSVVTSATAYFQIMNIKFSGKSNVKALEDALAAAGEDTDKKVVAINDHYELIVIYADSNEKIANTEFYKTEISSDIEGSDESLTESNVGIRLVFGDDSKADLATYISTGFEDIEAKYNSLITDLENDLE